MTARIHYRTTIPPALTPVTVEEAKEYMRFCDAPDDRLIHQFILSAVNLVEAYTGRALISQTIEATALRVRAGECIDLPRPRLLSVDSVTSSGVALSEDDYAVNIKAEPATITTTSNHDQLTVTYTAGYGASPDDVPSIIRTAIMAIVARSYDNRTEELPKFLMEQLLSGYRILYLK